MAGLSRGLPGPQPVLAVMGDLLGVPVTVKTAEKTPDPVAFWGAYVRDDDQLSVLCGVCLPLGAYCACALPGLPKGVATDALKAKKLDPAHVDTLREVVNVISSLFNVPEMPHVRLTDFAAAGTPGFAALAARLPATKARVDYTVQVDRFGAGTLTFATLETFGI